MINAKLGLLWQWTRVSTEKKVTILVFVGSLGYARARISSEMESRFPRLSRHLLILYQLHAGWRPPGSANLRVFATTPGGGGMLLATTLCATTDLSKT